MGFEEVAGRKSADTIRLVRKQSVNPFTVNPELSRPTQVHRMA